MTINITPHPVLVKPAHTNAEIARKLIDEAQKYKSHEQAEIVRMFWQSYLDDETVF
jgi:hypothetical protein